MAIKTFSQVVSAMVARILGAQPSVDTKAGTFVRDVAIEPSANEIGNLYSEIDSVSKAQSVDTGVGADVVRLAENYGLRRKAATRATGTVTFYRSGAPATDAVIPIGSSISTSSVGSTPAQTFTTTAAATLPVTGADGYYNADTGRYEVSTTVQASAGGAAGNVAAGSISTLLATISGIQGVTNSAALTGGTDQESIEALRVRVRDVLNGNSAVTQSGILSVVNNTAGVEDASVTEYSTMPGTVAVYVKGSNLVGTSDEFGYTSSQLSHTLTQQPVATSGTITVVGTSSGTLVSGADYQVTYDTAFYGGSTSGRTKIEWLRDLGVGEQTITVSYSYNSLVGTLQALVDADSARALGQSILIKQATAVPVAVGARIRMLAGYSFTSVQASAVSAVTSLLSRYTMAETVQQSDIASAIAAVAGVDEVKLPLTTFSASGIAQNDFGDLEMPGGSYASAGTITITQ